RFVLALMGGSYRRHARHATAAHVYPASWSNLMSRTRIAAFRVLRRRTLTLLAGAAFAFGGGAATWAQTTSQVAPLKVVATFSVLGDMVHEVGGEHVQLTTIVGPNGDAHTFEPTPKDVKALAQADVLVLNGLDFEGWLPRLLKASGFKGTQVLASQGVTVRNLEAGEFFAGEGRH